MSWNFKNIGDKLGLSNNGKPKHYRYHGVKAHEQIPIIVVDSPPMERKNPDLNQQQETSLSVFDSTEVCSNSNNKNNETLIGKIVEGENKVKMSHEGRLDNGGDDDDDDITEDEEMAMMGMGKRPSLRRNSISLPNLDDLKAFQHQVVPVENHNASDSGSDLEISSCRTPLRSVRRKSVTSPRMLKPPGDDEFLSPLSGSNSPANSITSVNSLASLLREKMQSLPATLRKKKSPDYKTKIFVGFLFIVIVVLICSAYFLYHQKVLQRAYFDKIKFNKIERLMKIFNDEGVEILTARLATTITQEKALPCLDSDERVGSICLEWMQRSRLYLKTVQYNRAKCYNLHWMSLSESIDPTDCLVMLDNSQHWYGGGQVAQTAWPLEKGGHDFSPFITGKIEKNQYGNVLKRYFIGSKGVAVIVDDATPLYVSIATNVPSNKKELCLKAKYDDFSFVNRLTTFPELNYTICTGENMTALHSHLTDNALWDGLKEEDMNIVSSLLTEPLWEIKSLSKHELTEETISNYTDNVIAMGFLKQGHVLINEFWQNQIGDFTVDTDRFARLEEAIVAMHRRGFRIVFSIQPFISTESFNFAEAVERKLLISERHSDWRIPALTRYKSLQSAGVLDPTNNRTIPWLLDQLKSVMAKYKFDAYFLDLGTAYDMPHYYQCEKPLLNPDEFKSYFVNSLHSKINLFGVNSAIERPKIPTFVSLPQFESSWEGLRRVIPTILQYGILGYPFIIPGAVGGDFKEQSLVYNPARFPDQELYVRWLQLSTFLPVIRHSHLPSVYNDDKLMDLARVLTSLRQDKITPLLKKYVRSSLDTGFPIIRPLWMLEYNDPACHLAVDEFSIGEDLIVAPVLHAGAREREIYLPAGVWRDGIDGSLRKGSRWIHDYRVELDKVAYFEKMPDNTRF